MANAENTVYLCLRCGNVDDGFRHSICTSCGFQKLTPTDSTDSEYWKLTQDESAVWAEQARERYVYHNKYFKRDDYERMLAKKAQFLNMVKNNTFPEKPKCPTCGSFDIKKIDGLNKAGAVAAFGVFSLGYVSKSFKCGSCGYKW